MAVWGADFAFTVASEMLPHLTVLLERNFECRLMGNIGPGMSLKVVKLLNRQLAWTVQGFEWHADTKGKSTSAVSPGSKASGTNIRDGEDYLDEKEAKECQCCGNLALSRFGPSGLAVHGGSGDVGNHEVTAETPGDDERCCA